MKVLFCHNYYRYRGGEDQSFEAEVRMLRSYGHDVITFTRNNADIPNSTAGRLHATTRTLYSRSARHHVAGLIREHRPDILHCNNLFPQISHSVYRPANRMGVPIVQALRNYRQFCANSFFLRDQKVCTDCLTKSASFDSLVHACYRDSRAASAVVTTMQLLQRSLHTLNPMVDAFFTPSQFARDIYVQGGFDAESLFVKRNFIFPAPQVGDGGSHHAIYVGRLSSEKGIGTIIDAYRKQSMTVALKIVGDGPMRSDVEGLAAEFPQVDYLGVLENEDVLTLIADAAFLLMPSLWFETFGRTMAEAFACGTPVIASRLGAMSELVTDGEDGFLFTAGDSADLTRAVQQLRSTDPAQYQRLRDNARRSFEQRYTREKNYQALIEIYEVARQRRHLRAGRRDTLTSTALPNSATGDP